MTFVVFFGNKKCLLDFGNAHLANLSPIAFGRENSEKYSLFKNKLREEILDPP